MRTPLDYLSGLLRERLDIFEVRRHRFTAGWQEAPVWINSSRLIFLIDGRLPYHVNNQTVELSPGDGLLVPINAQRSWSVPPNGDSELMWFRYGFESQSEPELETAYAAGIDVALEWPCLQRLIALTRDPTPATRLEAEGEVKAVLARFLVRAQSLGDPATADARPRKGDVAVNHAVLFINEHYAEPDVIDRVHERADLSVAYFRKLFKRQMGVSPQAYLTRRRMQVARYELHRSRRPIKQIAAEVGYDDPLYFSRIYVKYWGHPPSADHHRRWGGNRPD